jgi:hypothetical protein
MRAANATDPAPVELAPVARAPLAVMRAFWVRMFSQLLHSLVEASDVRSRPFANRVIHDASYATLTTRKAHLSHIDQFPGFGSLRHWNLKQGSEVVKPCEHPSR